MLNKRQKEELANRYAKRWNGDKRMIDYCVKKAAEIVELSDGDVLPVEKQEIEKDFCFGYTLNSYNSDSYDAAQDEAANAATNEDYFIRENMRKFKEDLDIISRQDFDGDDLPEYVIAVCGNNGIKDVTYIRIYDVINAFDNKRPVKDFPGATFKRYGVECRIPTREEIKHIKEAYTKAAEAHEKRVRTYLKKYGMKHVNTWTYWQDA